MLPPFHFEKQTRPAGPSENEIPPVINRQVCAGGVFRSQSPRALFLLIGTVLIISGDTTSCSAAAYADAIFSILLICCTLHTLTFINRAADNNRSVALLAFACAAAAQVIVLSSAGIRADIKRPHLFLSFAHSRHMHHLPFLCHDLVRFLRKIFSLTCLYSCIGNLYPLIALLF